MLNTGSLLGGRLGDTQIEFGNKATKVPAKSAADGSFTLEGLTPGKVVIEVRA